MNWYASEQVTKWNAEKKATMKKIMETLNNLNYTMERTARGKAYEENKIGEAIRKHSEYMR